MSRAAGALILATGLSFVAIAIYGYAAFGDREVVSSIAVPAGILIGLGLAIVLQRE